MVSHHDRGGPRGRASRDRRPEQKWIIEALIDYLDDERSGAGGYEGMAKAWVDVRNAARQRTLRPSDPGVAEIAESWDQFVEYLSLRLRQNLGRKVEPAYSRKDTPASRLAEYRRTLGDEGLLEATIKVPDAVGPIDIQADLASRQVSTSVRVPAPKDGRAKTRVNWLLRQLRDAPADVRVTAHFPHTRATTSLLIGDARVQPMDLLLRDDPRREPSSFDIALTRDMGTKRGKGRGSFSQQTMQQVLTFYGDVVQDLRKWTPPPPKLLDKQSTEPVEVEESDVRGTYVSDESRSNTGPT